MCLKQFKYMVVSQALQTVLRDSLWNTRPCVSLSDLYLTAPITSPYPCGSIPPSHAWLCLKLSFSHPLSFPPSLSLLLPLIADPILTLLVFQTHLRIVLMSAACPDRMMDHTPIPPSVTAGTGVTCFSQAIIVLF